MSYLYMHRSRSQALYRFPPTKTWSTFTLSAGVLLMTFTRSALVLSSVNNASTVL